MKRISLIICSLYFVLFGLSSVKPVYANEGKFSIVANGIDCEGMSVWQNGEYKISGICNGLVYPYHDQLSNYQLWVQPDSGGNPVRISQIDNGVISGSTVNRFTGIFITAEGDVAPDNPSTNRIVSGNLKLFNFPVPYQNQGNGQTVSQNQPTLTITITPSSTPSTALSTGPFNLGTRSFLTLSLIGFIIIVVFIVMFLFRR